MAKFVITRKECGKFQVILKLETGFILLKSREYAAKTSCKKAIERIRISARQADNFQKKVTVNWEPYFYLKEASGRIIGISEIHATNLSREQAIINMKKRTQSALIEDQSQN